MVDSMTHFPPKGNKIMPATVSKIAFPRDVGSASGTSVVFSKPMTSMVKNKVKIMSRIMASSEVNKDGDTIEKKNQIKPMHIKLTGISNLIERRCTINGEITPEIPRIKNKFAMFDPKILPKVMSDSLLMLAIIFTKSSGAEVPKASTVNPIKNSGMPRRVLMAEAPVTSQSAPFHKHIKLTINSITIVVIACSLLS